MYRRWWIVLALALAAGCSSHPAKARTYHLPPQKARYNETPLPYRPVKDGDMVFTVLGVTTGLTTLSGSHADLPARGQLVRVRVLAENDYATFHTVDLTKQLLVDSTGRTYAVDVNGMRVKRQPDNYLVGSDNQVEFDLIYDIPKSARVTSVHLYGDLTDELGVRAPSDPGVVARLTK